MLLTSTTGDCVNPIIELLKAHNVSDTQINELFQTLTANPMAAMANISQLGIPPEKLQQLMLLVMQQPELIKDAVESLGLDYAKVEAAKAQLKQ